MIEIQHLSKSYRQRDGSVTPVLQDIHLTVADQSITAIVGPSGAGKSTLSKCISLLEKPTEGSILVNGKDLSRLSGAALRRERRAIGTIFQSSALLHRRTVTQNIALPLEFLGVVPADIDRRVRELLAAVELTDKADHYPAQLSGGQQQRVGIARALALRPKVLLSDEATSGLDPQTTQSILRLLRRLRDEFDLSIILITHEMDTVRSVADSVAAIHGGRIVEQGRIHDLLTDPASPTGRQLAPLRVIAGDPAQVVAEVTYGASDDVPGDWLSALGERLNARPHLLGANVENIGGRLYGRARVGLQFQSSTAGDEAVLAAFRDLGLAATLRQPDSPAPAASANDDHAVSDAGNQDEDQTQHQAGAIRRRA